MPDLKDSFETDAFLSNIKAENSIKETVSIKETDTKMAGKRRHEQRHEQFMHRVMCAICMRAIKVNIARMRDDIHAVEMGTAECGLTAWKMSLRCDTALDHQFPEAGIRSTNDLSNYIE
jgi:hypothetical protein